LSNSYSLGINRLFATRTPIDLTLIVQKWLLNQRQFNYVHSSSPMDSVPWSEHTELIVPLLKGDIREYFNDLAQNAHPDVYAFHKIFYPLVLVVRVPIEILSR